jgi:transcriptional regulator with XRE-family HTH domain
MQTIRDRSKTNEKRPSTIHQPHQNIVGPQIRKLRMQKNWSQSKMAVKLQFAGFDVGRECIAKIEGQTRCVRDTDLFAIARVLNATLPDLFPQIEPSKLIADLERLRSKHQPSRFVPLTVQPKPTTPVYFSQNGCKNHNGIAKGTAERATTIINRENPDVAKNGLNGNRKSV